MVFATAEDFGPFTYALFDLLVKVVTQVNACHRAKVAAFLGRVACFEGLHALDIAFFERRIVFSVTTKRFAATQVCPPL